MAKFYPKVEAMLKKCAVQIGEAGKFDGDLLRYLTNSEMSRYLNGSLSLSKIVRELSTRREQYFYLYMEKENREEIVTDKKLIEKILAKFYDAPFGLKIIRGFSAYKGLARGRVYNMQSINSGHDAPKDGFVLVASMTRPDDVSLVKKCVAVVTDEGGILSHAAVIARELKKPCIIGTKIATKVLIDGNMVEVDANAGIIRIVKERK